MMKLFSYVAIPCEDFARAQQFYTAITGGLLQPNPNVPFPMAYVLDQENNPIGHLFQLESFKPSSEGPIVYLKVAGDLNEALTKIEQVGGQIVMPKTFIAPGKGHWALFLDTEGNRLALHSAE